MCKNWQEDILLKSKKTITFQNLEKAKQKRRQKWKNYALLEDETQDELLEGDPSKNPYIPRSRHLREKIRRLRANRTSYTYNLNSLTKNSRNEKVKFYAFLMLIGLLVILSIAKSFMTIPTKKYTIKIEIDGNISITLKKHLIKHIQQAHQYKIVSNNAQINLLIGVTKLSEGWMCYGFITAQHDYWKIFNGPTSKKDQCLQIVINKLFKRLGIVKK